MPQIFDSLLPAAIAVATFLMFFGFYAMSRRGGKRIGVVFIVFAGIALIFAGIDYQQSVGDAEIALLLIGAGAITLVLSAWEML